MAAVLPVLIKRNYKDDPLFAESKVVVSLYDNAFPGAMNHRLAEKMMMDGIDAADVKHLTDPTYENLMRHAISFSDGVIVTDEAISSSLTDFAAESKKPVLLNHLADDHSEACSNFYDEVLLGEQVAEMAD